MTTDGSGQYRIENLRPGTYVVTFTLSGFSSVRREGIELFGTFVAPVNVEMAAGNAAEAKRNRGGKAQPRPARGNRGRQRATAEGKAHGEVQSDRACQLNGP